MRAFLCFLCIGVLFVAPAAAKKVTDEDYFGVWIDEKDAPGSCITEGEGDHFVLHRNYYEPGDGAACSEAKTWLHGDRLRVSANCEGEEYGFRATVRELRLISPNRLGEPNADGKGERRFVHCVMPKQTLKQSQLDTLRKVSEALAALNDNGEQDRPRLSEAARTAQERKILASGGFSSRAEYEQIEYLVSVIMRFLDETAYIERRHNRSNVELVRANRATLMWILTTE